MNKSFIPYELQHGLLADLSNDKFPTELWGFKESEDNELILFNNGTHFGYIHDGKIDVILPSKREFTLTAGMYFSIPTACRLLSAGWNETEAIIITRLNYKGMFSIGGPIESTGRLRYIDGCTDSLLIPPVMKGNPCLNALYFPPNARQTLHTHPSMRVGIVVAGWGECDDGETLTALMPGRVFVIPANAPHCFRTDESAMTVIAYHPDSEYGPTHETHPMIKSTYVNNISASMLEEIHTHESFATH